MTEQILVPRRVSFRQFTAENLPSSPLKFVRCASVELSFSYNKFLTMQKANSFQCYFK